MKCNHLGVGSCLERVPIFGSLNCDEREEIIEIASSKTFEKGEIIYSAGDSGGTLFVLYTGKVKLYRLTSSGKEQVLGLVGEGDFIGELSLFSSLPQTDYAQALEKTTMCILEGKKLKVLMSKYPSIAFKVMDELSRRLESAKNRIEDISLHSVTKRVASALLNISKGKDEFSLPMTKGDLASQLGMTQESLSRKLTNFQDEGLIKLQGQRKIIINDKNALEELSLNP